MPMGNFASFFVVGANIPLALSSGNVFADKRGFDARFIQLQVFLLFAPPGPLSSGMRLPLVLLVPRPELACLCRLSAGACLMTVTGFLLLLPGGRLGNEPAILFEEELDGRHD